MSISASSCSFQTGQARIRRFDNEEKKEHSQPGPEEYISTLKISRGFTEKAVRGAIHDLGLFDGCKILDVPCGIGSHSKWMVEENPNVEIVGIDIAKAHLDYAEKQIQGQERYDNIVFRQGDMTNLPCDNNVFDFLWCCDGLWPGNPENEALVESPYPVLDEFKRTVKPGGMIALVFWTAQKLLPGYPFLETALSATVSSNRPLTRQSPPEFHMLCAPQWLIKTGCTNVTSSTFACDITGPFSQEDESGMVRMTEMFWGGCEGEVEPEIWQRYTEITDPDHSDFIFRQEGYSALVTYTMTTGIVV